VDAIRFSQITLPELTERAKPQGAGGGGFGELLKEGMTKLQGLQAEAEQQSRQLIAGEPVELHRVVLAGEQAALAFELTMAIRNKAVEAYQEVMRMQV
jgi:flagellar hook-basal body complex protein FliE